MKILNKILVLLSFFSVLFVSSCKKDKDTDDLTGTGSITIEFDNIANGNNLVLGNKYINANGDTMTFSMFDYYISNIVLVKSDGSTYTVSKDNSYFLIKESVSTSQEITLSNIPAGDYTSVKFVIGVDSLKSTAPVSERTGVLDPAGAGAGMYWAWNSGYIFVKVEGESPQAPLSGGTHPFQYHIGLYGGYSSPTLNNIKTVTLSDADGDKASIRKTQTPHVHILVDIMEMFKSPTAVSVAANPLVHGSSFSATIANNYADMFKIDHIHND